MARYFFHISNGHPFTDSAGEELLDDAAAWDQAVRTVRDVESSLNLGDSNRWSLEVNRGDTPIFRIDVAAHKLSFGPR